VVGADAQPDLLGLAVVALVGLVGAAAVGGDEAVVAAAAARLHERELQLRLGDLLPADDPLEARDVDAPDPLGARRRREGEQTGEQGEGEGGSADGAHLRGEHGESRRVAIRVA
jgi:hypothetical protein